MALKIKEKLEAARDRIAGGDKEFAEDLASDGMKAVFAGIGTFDHTGIVPNVNPEWKKLMENFTDDPIELARLCGQDRAFNASEWGKACLVYIAGDSICTAATAKDGGTTRTMSADPVRGMLSALDAQGPELAALSLSPPLFNR